MGNSINKEALLIICLYILTEYVKEKKKRRKILHLPYFSNIIKYDKA